MTDQTGSAGNTEVNEVKRVLIVLGSGRVGGIERLMVDLLRVLRDDTEVACDLFFRRPEGPFHEEALEASSVKRIHADAGLLTNLRLFKRYDLLHLQGFTPSVAAAAWLAKRPIIYHEHGTLGLGRKPMWRDIVKHPMRRSFVRSRRVRRTIAVSRFIDALATDYYGLRWSRKSAVVYNGTRMGGRRNDPSAPSPDGAAIVLGYLGRLAGAKRLDRLLHLVSEPPRTWTARIAGEGPELDSLQQTVMNMGLQGRVTIEGPTSDVGEFYEAIDCLVLPTRSEAFGLVVLEAWSYGLPAFVFADGGGAAEVVSRLDPFFVCRTSGEMHARITEFFEDTDRQKEFLAKVVQMVDEFSIEKFKEQIKNQYLLLDEASATTHRPA